MKNWILRMLAVAVCTLPFAANAQQSNDVSAEEEAGAIAEQYRDWVLRCRKREDSDSEACALSQRLVTNGENQQVVLRVTIIKPDRNDNRLSAVFVFPLGLYLPAGAELRIDGAAPQPMLIERCFPRGCRATLPLSDSLVNAMRAGSKANFVVERNPDDEVELGISLMGFSAGYKALLARVAN